MTEIALYYPHVHPRDERWIKQAVLFWPRIERIVPRIYPPSDSRLLTTLVARDILVDRPPDAASDEIGAAFTELLAREHDDLAAHYGLAQAFREPPRKGWNDAFLEERLGWIHAGKLDRSTRAALASSDLVVRDDREPDWYGMHPKLSDVYMCALTGTLVRQSGGLVTPVTDSGLHLVASFGWTVPELARGLLPALSPETSTSDTIVSRSEPEAMLLAVAVRALVPERLDEIPIERILAVRDQHRSEFSCYRQALEAMTAAVRDLDPATDPQTLARHVDELYEQHIGTELRDLREALRRHGVKTGLTSLSLDVIGSTSAAMVAVSQIASVGVAAGASAAVAVARASYEAGQERRAAQRRSPAGWLLRVERGLTPRRLTDRLARILTRFRLDR